MRKVCRGGSQLVRCASCGSYLPEGVDCVAEQVEDGEKHTGLCWRGHGVDEEMRSRLVGDLVRASQKRIAVQLKIDIEEEHGDN